MFEPLQTAILCLSIIVGFIALVWMLRTIHSGNGFYKEIETSNGTVKKRLEFDLIAAVLLGALAFVLNVLVIGDFLCLIVFEEWAFYPEFTKGSLLMVLIVFSVYVAKKIYEYTLDKAERKVRIREV